MFSFGIITDTHVRAPAGDLSSPYAVNDLANDRARYATALLAAQQPDFVIHLGDMVHPLPEMAAYGAACEEASRIFKPLQPNLHYVPGNHDIGDKPAAGAPATVVNNNGIEKYQAQFGASWNSFEHRRCCFITINSSLVNTGLAQEEKQFQWLKNTLEATQNQRVIVFSHYPLFVHDAAEAAHYDNIAEPGRQQLLELFSNYQVELVFSGHVHHFFYNQQNDCAFYILPPTSFTRQDYAELFAIEPAPEFGRDDTGKYSVTLVHILEQGHELQLLPTGGQSMKKDQPKPESLPRQPRATINNITVSLRHAWHESRYLPYNGPMEEFSRKRARNDYGLLRLLQMGVRDVRVPVQDLLDESSRKRMQDYNALGMRFHLFALAADWAATLSAVATWNACVSSLECVLSGPPDSWPLTKLQWPATTPVAISYAASGAHQSDSGKPFAHSVSTGFLWSDQVTVFERINATCASKISRIIFQIPWEAELQSTLAQMEQVFADSPWSCAVYLRVANSNPAAANVDDEKIAQRIQNAQEWVSNADNLSLVLDTFMDIDRGYSPRNGLIDRYCNFRLAGCRLAGLSAG